VIPYRDLHALLLEGGRIYVQLQSGHVMIVDALFKVNDGKNGTVKLEALAMAKTVYLAYL
jgi:hypothetical protein